ncbi:MAG: GNAT family N-acetyltransferase [Actinomycetota bacterium]
MTDTTSSTTTTMYGADWCGDCRRSKAWFEANGVDYAYVDLAARPEAVDIVLERNNGLKRIPVIVFPDGSHLTEPSDEALAAKVAELASAETPTGADAHHHAGPTFEVVDVTDADRFELRRDGTTVGLASYRRQGDRVIIPHVETFPEHRGQGYAARLMDGALAQIRAAGDKVVPLCPFAAAHIRDHPGYHDLVA